MQGNLEASSLDVLSSALDLARVGLARWDAEDRLVAFNDTYRKLVYPNLQDEVRLGFGTRGSSGFGYDHDGVESTAATPPSCSAP